MACSTPSWYEGFISGVVATVIGFVLTMVWDIVKHRRDVQAKDELILIGYDNELNDNLEIIDRNFHHLSEDTKIATSDMQVIVPLARLKNEAATLINLHLPLKLVKNPNLHNEVRDLSFSIDRINEVIHNREEYRIASEGMSNYGRRRKLYNETLMQMLEHIKNEIAIIKNLL